MNNSIREAARKILANKRAQYQSPATIVPASEVEFGHLDIGFYARLRAGLEKNGFRHIADHEILEVTNSPGTLLARTFIRVLAAADGAIVADYYQIRPRLPRLAALLLRGLMNFRWIAAPRFFFHTLKTKHCYGFETEFSDGSFLTTSNAEAAGKLSLPPSIQSEFYPYSTPVSQLLKRHRERLQDRLSADASLSVRPVNMEEQLLAMQARMKSQKNAHRAAVSWVTREEMEKLSSSPEQAQAVFAEVQRLLREEEGAV